jgi:integrase/recombinase XerC
MKVVVQDNQRFYLRDSVLHDEPDSAYHDAISLLEGEVLLVKGAVVFDSQMKVMPMISQWLTYSVRYNKIAPGTADTYGKNIGYFIDYLQSHPVFKTCIDDQACVALMN